MGSSECSPQELIEHDIRSDGGQAVTATAAQGRPSARGGCPLDVPMWHVMRISYGREFKAYDALCERGVECYVPMVPKPSYDRDGNRSSVRKSLIANTLFVRGTTQEVFDLKNALSGTLPLMFAMDHTKEPPVPMTIRDKTMEDFMEVTAQKADSLLWLDHPADVLVKGRKVRVTYGPLQGREGYVLRIKRDRRFVLSLDGLVSAAIMNVDDFRYDWVEPIGQ